MKAVIIRIKTPADLFELCRLACLVSHGDILASRGRICVDLRSIVGAAAMNWNENVTISYHADPHDEGIKDFENFLEKFRVA